MATRQNFSIVEAGYRCTFRPAFDGESYVGRCAVFPEILCCGGSLEETRHMVREAIGVCVEARREEGRPVPTPYADPKAQRPRLFAVQALATMLRLLR